jgi:hypothetical protein
LFFFSIYFTGKRILRTGEGVDEGETEQVTVERKEPVIAEPAVSSAPVDAAESEVTPRENV